MGKFKHSRDQPVITLATDHAYQLTGEPPITFAKHDPCLSGKGLAQPTCSYDRASHQSEDAMRST